jgi:hypothetical protein
VYCFIYLLCISYLDTVDFDNLQEVEDQDFEQQVVGEQGK